VVSGDFVSFFEGVFSFHFSVCYFVIIATPTCVTTFTNLQFAGGILHISSRLISDIRRRRQLQKVFISCDQLSHNT